MSGDILFSCPIHGQYFPNMVGAGCPQCTTFFPFQPYNQPQFNPIDLTGIKFGTIEEKRVSRRKYLPTLSELIDRLTISQQKELKLPEKREEYTREVEDIVHDIGVCLAEEGFCSYQATSEQIANMIRDVVVLTLMNCTIWQNESNFRKGIREGNNLELTHGLNGIRNTAKNKIQELVGGRKDYKVDNVEAFKDWVPSGYGKKDEENK